MLAVARGRGRPCGTPPGEGGSDARGAEAAQYRTELRESSQAALRALGDAPPWIIAAEADIRSYVHDALHAHHDKDYRCLVACPLAALKERTLQIHRVGGGGRLCLDHVMGVEPGAEDTVIPLLIWKGHMRLVFPPTERDAVDLGRRWARDNQLARELVSVGLEEMLDEGPDAEPTVPSKGAPCAHCKEA